jgi:hypothetical protein
VVAVTAVTDTRTWTLEIPAPAAMYSANTRVHWRRTHEARKLWREAAFIYATQAKLPRRLARVRIDIAVHFTVNRGRDNENYSPHVGKPIGDGLAKPHGTAPGYLLIVDDTPEFLDGPFVTVGVKVDKKTYPLGLAVVTITDLGGEVS